MNPTPSLLRTRRPAGVGWLLGLAALFCLPVAGFAGFGYTDLGSAYSVDTGAGLVFQVSKTDGTITSIVYNGVEYNGPSGKGSHLSSGLGSATVTPETDGATYVKLTLQTGTSGTADPNMTQYLVVRNGENTIYMATFPGQEPNVGELRWITRLNHSLLPNGPVPSNLDGNTGPIESQDVFGMPDGTTRSKYYGDSVTHGKERAMDLTYDGATGANVGVWMIFGNRESSSGGPFFRDIQDQAGGDQEIYNYMNSGHNQTEAYRLNVLHGPYALVFTNGAPPSFPLDFSWMGNLNLQGWVAASGRGAVSGTATGIPAGFQGVVGFANATAQYWAIINPADGSYTCSGMKPGTYTVTLYKQELEVGTSAVTVTAGATTPLNVASTEPMPSVIFRIGEWDGTPAGFLNAGNLITMHPSDVRQSSWGPVTYTVGVDNPSAFPALQFRGANNPTTVKFKLAPNQVTNLTVRIGITAAYNGSRPSVTVNGFNATVPPASSQPDSRSITIGTYRGNNQLYTYSIPSSALVAGVNTMQINATNGSPDAGTWLSASYACDAVELDGPIATPVITYAGSNPLVVSGTAEPGRTIAVTLDGATPAGTTTASPSGTWSITYAGALSTGSHTFTAVASDTTGHSSPTSTGYTLNTAVTMPVITAAVGDTGTYASGATTSDRVFVFNGTAGAGDSVTLVRIGVGVIGTVVASGTGQWAFDYTGVSLPDGVNSFYATASNATGTSPSSAIFSLNLQGAPRVAIVRYNPTAQVITTLIGSVVYRVTFNTTVSGVSTSSFALTATNTAGGTIASVSATSGTVFDVTVNALTGTGNLRLDLVANNGIVNASNQPEGPYNAGQPYTLVVPTTGNGTWTNPITGGHWSDPQNWLNAVIADGSGNTGDFSTLDLTADNTVHLDGPRTLTNLVFGDTDPTTPAGWLVDNNGSASNTLTLSGSAPTITVGALGTGAATTISAVVAGSSGFTKAGVGTLVLTAANAVTGTLNVNAGTLALPASASMNLGSGPVNIGLNSVLDVTGGSFATSGLVTAATGAMVVDSGTATLGSFRTNSTFGSTLRVNGGTLTVGDVNIRRNAAGSPDFGSGFIVAGGSATATTIGLGTDNSYGCLSVQGNGALTATGVVTLGNQATSGRGGALQVVDTGTFTSTESSTGIVLVRRNSNNASATFTGGVSTVEKFTLGFDSTITSGNATITVNGGTLYLGSGGIVKNGAASLGTSVTLRSGTIGAKANWSTIVSIALPSGGNVVLQASDAANVPFAITLAGVVSGAGGFSKTGSGVLTLDGAVTHTFTGPVNINAGMLRVTSTLASATSGITVNSTGVLGGNGTVNRPITLNSGGTIAPDGAGAIATLTGTTLTWNDGGVYAVDLGAAPATDQLVLSGALTKGTAGTYTLVLNATAGVNAGDIYTVATFGSTTFAPTDFTASGLPPGFGGRVLLTPTTLRVLVVARPVITSPTTATGTYGAPFTYTIAADNGPTSFSATGLPPGLSIDPATGVITGTPSSAGAYTVGLGATNEGGTGTATLSLDIAKAVATVTVGVPGNSTIRRFYDGNPQPANITSAPSGLAATFTYNGSTTVPTLPGTYDVVATIDDHNYTGTATGKLVIGITALVRHAPVLNGDLDGSAQILTGENLTLNGGVVVSGDLLVPGMPSVRLNGNPTLVGTKDMSGSGTPANYAVTLNGNAMARYVVRRVDPIPMPTVVAPQPPSGTRSVVVNRAGDPIGDFATVRNLTLNGNVGAISVPPGAYGSFIANGGSSFVLGVPGATQPSVYELQQLVLNGNASLQVVGPVILRLGSTLVINGSLGAASDPSLLTLEVASGGLTLNGSATLNGTVTAPNGTVMLNGGSVLNGSVTADRLTINGSSILIQAP